MINPNEFYDKTKAGVNEELIDKLLDKYLKISYKDMNWSETDIENYKNVHGGKNPSISQLYSKINNYDDEIKPRNIKDSDLFFKEINRDFFAAGMPFDPSTHGGITNPLAVMPGWYTLKSWYILGTDKIHDSDFAHRFYFGIPNDQKYRLANVLYDEFKNANIPFYFKINVFDEERTDNIVLYTSNALLEETINVLRSVETKMPDLINLCGEPSIIVGKFTNKIGYASENPTLKTSYTDLICTEFIDSLDTVLDLYANKNVNPRIINAYKSKINKYLNAGKKVEMRARRRILLEVLLNEEPVFKSKLLDEFKKRVCADGLDLNNICFSNNSKSQMESQYDIGNSIHR